MASNQQQLISSQEAYSANNSSVTKKHDIEQPILHALIHCITVSGYFHAVAFNLLTQLMVYAQTINHMYLFCAGTLFGLFLGFGLCQNMCKRKILMISDVIFALGIGTSFITYSYYMICSVILGFSVSLSLFVLLLEIKEIVPKSHYLAEHMCIYQIYYCLGLLVSELTQINLNTIYNEASNGFDASSFGSGQIVFLSTTMALVLIRCLLLASVFKISTPFELIRFHHPKQQFVNSVHKLYAVANEENARMQVVKKYNHTYIQPENKLNPAFWKEVREGFLMNFFAQASGCQIFMNSQQISIDNQNLQNLSTWMLLVLGLCGLVGAFVGYFFVNRYTRVRWAKVGLIFIVLCQGFLAAFTKQDMNTFGVFCGFHFLISLCFLPAIYSFCAQKFLERGLLICHLGLWLGFFTSVMIFYYSFLNESQYNATSFIIFSVIAFVGLIFISFYTEEPDHCLYLDSNQKQENDNQVEFEEENEK